MGCIKFEFRGKFSEYLRNPKLQTPLKSEVSKQ